MKPCLSEATTLPCSFADDLGHFASAGCTAMEVWLPKLETHLETQSLEQTRQLVAERGMTLAAAAYQGGLLLSQGDARKVHYDHFRKRLALCEALSISTLLVVADFAGTVDSTMLERAVVSLAQAAQWAAGFGVTLGLEFRARSSFCTSLDTALALVAQCGEPNVGINLDVFHYYTGPSKFDDFDLLTAERLAHVQLSDLAGVPRELAEDSDRVLPGDGDFRLDALLERLRQCGYQSWVSLELMNPMLWQTNPVHVAEIGMNSLRRALSLPDRSNLAGK